MPVELAEVLDRGCAGRLGKRSGLRGAADTGGEGTTKAAPTAVVATSAARRLTDLEILSEGNMEQQCPISC